jgi:hypothetical protein
MIFRVDPVGQHRILDFDIENRPLTYWWGDATTAEITAIAWSWVGEEEVHVRTLQPPPDDEGSALAMVDDFMQAFDEADVVTGHYIRKHDLPIINASLVELGLAPMSSKLTSDTKLDLLKTGQLAVSQQALGGMFHLEKPKVAMPQQKWRDANRLTPAGIEGAIGRVVGDVLQHKEMRAELLERGLLKPPSLWRP